MTDFEQEIIHNPPLCTNIQRRGAYLLAPDEVQFFDWLTIKQSLVFNDEWFYYSQPRIEEEIKIKKDRLNVIVKRFVAMGILETSVRKKPNDIGCSKYYRLNYSNVLERISEIIDSHCKDFFEFKKYFEALNVRRCEKDSGNYKPHWSEKVQAQTVQQYHEALCETYKRRITMYNNGKLTYGRPVQIPITQLPIDAKIKNAILRLSERYEIETVRGAFVAYIDAYLSARHGEGDDKHLKKVKRILSYFLSYDKDLDCFSVVDLYLEKYQKSYEYES